MSWQPTDVMSLKKEFVKFAKAEGSNVSELCRRYGISRKTGYKWLQRYAQQGEEGLADRPRRPVHSPRQTPGAVAQSIEKARREHPAWGARKLRAFLERRSGARLPAVSTVHAVLERGGLITPEAREAALPWQRFERSAPNELWQMDFKGHFDIGTRGARCHPLTVLDDHSRYNLELKASPNETMVTVQRALSARFQQYGLPLEILCDNGPPWGCPGGRQYWTKLGVWLLRAGVRLTHGRPLHPQTQGKEERFHRTLKAELLNPGYTWATQRETQRAFDQWRETYNHHRPHEALGLKVPADVYVPSSRGFKGTLPPVERYYLTSDEQRQVLQKGQIAYGGRRWHIGEGFSGQRVALRDTDRDGVFTVWFCRMPLGEIDLSRPVPAVSGTWENLNPLPSKRRARGPA
jgi:transposase InsO family protein